MIMLLLPWMKHAHSAPLAEDAADKPANGRTTASSSSSGGWSFNDSEKCFMNKINRRRQRQGKSQLHMDKQLGYVARRHARTMARSGYMYHDADIGSKVTRWRTIAQNTGK